MIWAKEEKKRFFPRPRMAMMTMYTVGLCILSLAAFANEPLSYAVTQAEAERAIADALQERGLGEAVEASIVGRRSPELVRRTVPVVMEIHDLEAEKGDSRFTATLAFSTEATLERPAQKLGHIAVVGRYDEMVEVPVVKFRMNSTDVIKADDVEWQRMPAARLKRDTVLELEDIVGMSPVRGLTPGRAIETAEVQAPALVLRRSPVRMSYQSERINIQAVGTAMQDGAMGQTIKVRNDNSGLEVDARVVSRGEVEVMPMIAYN